MSKRKKRAVLQAEDLVRIRAAAKATGPREHALIEWLYTNGARASEPGLARRSDLDLHNNTVMLTHLKGGLASEPVPLSKRCATALKDWLTGRVVAPDSDARLRDYIFPSAHPARCYPCLGKGQIAQKRRKKKDGVPEMYVVTCPHCHGVGTRFGITRHEVRRIIAVVFVAAGIPKEFHFPHVLRHSAVTHMLDRDALPTSIQERVGHKSLATTYGYMHTTKKARAMVTKTFDEDDEEG
jgi:site-specific recombinase XerD